VANPHVSFVVPPNHWNESPGVPALLFKWNGQLIDKKKAVP
jgi:hypothetical protein